MIDWNEFNEFNSYNDQEINVSKPERTDINHPKPKPSTKKENWDQRD